MSITAAEFAEYVYRHVVEDNLRVYASLLRQDATKIGDAAWRKIADAHRTMNSDQRAATQLLASLVLVDAVSNVLGILDGTCILEEHRQEFRVLYGDGNAPLNGSLQDIFLAIVEQRCPRE